MTMIFDTLTKTTESSGHEFTWEEWAAFLFSCPPPDEVREEAEIQMVWNLPQGQLNVSTMSAVWVYDPQD